MSKPVGLRTEIITTLSLLMGAALLLGGVLMLRLTEQSLLEQKVAQLRIMTGMLAHSLAVSSKLTAPSATKLATPFALNLLNELPDELDQQDWWLYDADLQLIASYRSDSSPPFSAARYQQLRLSGQPLETVEFPSLVQLFSVTAVATAQFAEPLYVNNRFLGVLDIRYSLDDIRHRLLLSQQLLLLYVLLYGSVLVAAGYYLLQRNVIKPARDLLQATEDVSRGNLETRLPVAGPLEIAHLADAYNHMVDALQSSRAETQSHISALQLTNAELQQAREELIRSEKLASVGQLAAGLAHELGNPLAALIGYLEILKIRITTSAEQDVVKRSLTEAGRIDYLVRELLDYSRPTATVTDRVDPLVELRNSLQLLKHQGVFAGLTLLDHLPVCETTVLIDRQKLQQVFINLLLNAVQACIEQGQVTVAAELVDDSISLLIIDNGCGIAADKLGKIFDPFFTTKAPGKGTGLGLAICQRIVAEAGGEIVVQSTPKKGSVFRVKLKTLPS